MLTTTTSLLVVSLSTIAALAVIAGVFAWSWKGWLDLKRHELGHADFAGPTVPAGPAIGNRIELADLRERVKKLEAIAAGVDM